MDLKRLVIASTLMLSMTGCASIISSATQNMADNLSRAILNQNDMDTVKAGAPAYLIMIDSFIEGDADNSSMLRSGAKLYASYTSAFVDDAQRAKRLAQKSYDYAHRALCLELETLCASLKQPLDELNPLLQEMTERDQPMLYDFAAAWAGWIQVNSDDWNAIAQIPKLKALFQRSIQLNESYDLGGAHIYLAVLASQIPPSLGGKPEVGRQHFERARMLSGGDNLMINVLYAEHYARLVFDQQLHDQLLQQVLHSEKQVPGLILVNTIARHRATILLQESTEFF